MAGLQCWQEMIMVDGITFLVPYFNTKYICYHQLQFFFYTLLIQDRFILIKIRWPTLSRDRQTSLYVTKLPAELNSLQQHPSNSYIAY